MCNFTGYDKYTFEIRDPDFKIILSFTYNMLIIEYLGI